MQLLDRLPPLTQEVVAFGIERELMEKLATTCRSELPANCRGDSDYLGFLTPKGLKALAESYFSSARATLPKVSGAPEAVAAVAALELTGYYLLARSWQDLERPIDINAPGLGAQMIGFNMERQIGAFLRKYGRAVPRSC